MTKLTFDFVVSWWIRTLWWVGAREGGGGVPPSCEADVH